jgi:hypothetical protein
VKGSSIYSKIFVILSLKVYNLSIPLRWNFFITSTIFCLNEELKKHLLLILFNKDSNSQMNNFENVLYIDKTFKEKNYLPLKQSQL